MWRCGVTQGTVPTLVKYTLFEVEFAGLPQFDVLFKAVTGFESGRISEV